MSKTKRTIKRLRKAFAHWTYPLGVRWWELHVHYFDSPDEIVRLFAGEDGKTVIAKTFVDWKYNRADIDVNVPACYKMTDEEIDRLVVHELLHVLVAEMHEGEMHHEERVVSNLTNAVFWVKEGIKENK